MEPQWVVPLCGNKPRNIHGTQLRNKPRSIHGTQLRNKPRSIHGTQVIQSGLNYVDITGKLRGAFNGRSITDIFNFSNVFAISRNSDDPINKCVLTFL